MVFYILLEFNVADHHKVVDNCEEEKEEEGSCFSYYFTKQFERCTMYWFLVQYFHTL